MAHKTSRLTTVGVLTFETCHNVHHRKGNNCLENEHSHTIPTLEDKSYKHTTEKTPSDFFHQSQDFKI